nr:MAG TPA: hypothetical protein [Caudoviricetes sp.]
MSWAGSTWGKTGQKPKITPPNNGGASILSVQQSSIRQTVEPSLIAVSVKTSP